MPAAVLDRPEERDLDPVAEPAAVTDLFEEARRRRRRRLVACAVGVCLVLASGAGFLIAGGSGWWFGGPPAHSVDRGPTGGTTTHPPSPTARPSATRGGSVCGRGIIFLTPPGHTTGASLLPCYEAPTFPKNVATYPSP